MTTMTRAVLIGTLIENWKKEAVRHEQCAALNFSDANSDVLESELHLESARVLRQCAKELWEASHA